MLNTKAADRVLQKLEHFAARLEGRLFTQELTLDATMFETEDRLHTPPDAAGFVPVRPGHQWGGEGATCWFAAGFTVPERLEGEDLYLMPHTGGMESLLWVDGVPKGTFTGPNAITAHGNHYCGLLVKNARAGQRVSLAVEAYAGHYVPGCVPLQTLPKTSLCYVYEGLDVCIKDAPIQDFYFDLRTFLQMANTLEESSFFRAEIRKTLLEVAGRLYLSEEDTAPADWLAAVLEAAPRLKALYAYKNPACAPVAAVIGHSHMDTAWQWTIGETVRKCARTYANQLSLMEQYPEYQFIQSSAFHGELMRRHYPALFEGMRQAVAEGRYEPNGGVWVECDCNLTSGESMIRQFLWGQRFTQKHFGYTSNCFWLPDTFGYSAAIPQIMKGCRVDYFLTTKLSWNDTNRFPYDTFYWQGIDGTRVLAHLNKTHTWPDPQTCITQICRAEEPDGLRIKEVANMRLIAYGYGDGGGGPQFEMIEMARRAKDLQECPKVQPMLVGEFMQKLEATASPPLHRGELYLELHRGALTSQHDIKRLHRGAEIALHNLEYLLCRRAWARRAPAATEERDRLLGTLLVNQFHDILPGTCITPAHRQAKAELAAVCEEAGQAAREMLLADAQPGEGISLTNTLAFAREDVFYLDTGGRYLDVDAPQQLVPMADGKTLLALAGATLPPLSSVFFPFKAGERVAEGTPFRLQGRALQTPFYDVVFNDKMYIESLFDRQANRELCAGGHGFGTLLYGEDVPLDWDNWDIDADTEAKLADCATLTQSEVIANGEVELRLRLTYQMPDATSVQMDLCFYAHRRDIRYEATMHWQTSHRLLKAAFDTSICAEYIRQEIQFGYVQRPTNRNTTQEQARFETCNHKYSDLSETRYGIALLNDCKYGISAEGGSMRLSLHKGGTRPDTEGDLGTHHCVYTLLPHMGGFASEAVILPAYMLNYPPLAAPGRLEKPSFAAVDAPNVLLETIKPGEDDPAALVLRLYEAEGTHSSCTLTLPDGTARWQQTNMLEEAAGEWQAGSTAKLTLHPFEIKTIMVCR